MENTEHCESALRLLDDLSSLAEKTNQKSLDDNSDDYFNQNINFFTKSFLVLMCAYLESYIKDVSYFYIQHIEQILASQKIPKNLIRWSVLREKFDHTKEREFTNLKLNFLRDDVDKNTSPNPYITSQFFIRLGIDLSVNSNFTENKESIQAIVTKRNNIIHHNDDASDIGLADITEYVSKIKNYINTLDHEIRNSIQ